MQEAVRRSQVVMDWLQGTRHLIASDDPTVKNTAMQKFGLADEAAWQRKKTDLLAQIDKSLSLASAHSYDKRTPANAAEPFVPADEFGARFQSAMAETMNDRFTTAAAMANANLAAPYGPPEKFDSGDAGWIVVLFARLEEASRGKHVFIHSNDNTVFRYDLPSSCTVALFADWATGEAPAIAIKQAIEKRNPQYTIHLGDTYYAGFADEVRHNLISCWPGGVQFGRCFAMNGNHEMYSGGNAYFDVLTTLGHSASYFNLGNKDWRLIGLDTSWCELGGDTIGSSWGQLADPQPAWLDAQIADARAANPNVKIILLTHHQLFSAFDGDKLGQKLRQQLGAKLTDGSIFAWFWGHEHRGIVYGNVPSVSFKARCIGHGGFPCPPCTEQPAHADKFPIAWKETRCEPTNAWYGMRGFALLQLNGPSAQVEYIDQTGEQQYKEEWP